MLPIKNHHKAGLSLLEVIISLGIVSLMLTPLLMMHTGSLRTTHDSSAASLKTIDLYNTVSTLHRTYLNPPMPESVVIQDKIYRTQDFAKDSILFAKDLVYAALTNNENTTRIEYITFMIKKDHE